MKSAVVVILQFMCFTPIVIVDILAKSYALLISHLWAVALLIWIIYLLKPKVRRRYEKIFFNNH